MKLQRYRGLACWAVGASLWFCSCSTAPESKKIENTAEFPQELSKEYNEKFTVKDAITLEEKKPETPPQVTVKKGQKKAKKIKTAISPPAKPTATFNYPNRRPNHVPFEVGEHLEFDVTYLGMVAGVFTLDALPYKAVNERKVYHVKGTAVTSSVFNLFYRVNDWAETYFDYDGFFSYRFRMVLDETKQARDHLELYDSEKKQTFFWNRWDRKQKGYSETKDFKEMEPFPQDGLSALYYLRTLEFKEKEKVEFPVVTVGSTWHAEAYLLRKEKLNTPFGKKQTLVLKLEPKYGGVLTKKGDVLLWLSDDEYRYPLRLEAKVKIGSIAAVLTKTSQGQ